jgi:acetyl esterase
LRNLPPANVGIAEIDCLADDSFEYAARLKDAGNVVQLQVAKGMIHGYLRSRFSGSQAELEFDTPCKFLRRWLGVA